VTLLGLRFRQSSLGMDFSSPVTPSSLSEPSWLVAECETDNDAVNDSADCLAACDGMIPPEDLRVSMSMDSEEVTKTSFYLEGVRFRKSSM